MVRKIKKQPTPTPRASQADTAFTQLLITALRIYGDPSLRAR
jgi:hypothetical protein